MSGSIVSDLCKAYAGPLPYGPDIRWDGSSWVSVDCSKRAVGRPLDVRNTPGYQNAFSGVVLDGSDDIGIPAIEVPRSATPVVSLPGGSVGIPVVDETEEEPCSCKGTAQGKRIWWLVGIALALWML